ncbi:aromatic ring-hydroxylating dioxygenase subunit alpha [Rhodococcus sp. IEGM 1366]|uniref:aromatic ring-hydroxylating oxygenase subunit alpha n=1 Tax=Rhodococcus sp. IEGM 1366 TaxID=3082223 RepID=UPI0029555DD7|nr:aromatic ring-hydroxylating dioxygenase subunit alpha [Rhodococcus sp. IEGM 1366]
MKKLDFDRIFRRAHRAATTQLSTSFSHLTTHSHEGILVTTHMDRSVSATTPETTAEQLEVNPLVPANDVDTTGVPFRMNDGVHIPAERYYDKSFADLENKKLWMNTWQWAARVEDIPNPGDYIEYTVVDESVFVVRTDADTIKVFQNVCPHRATRLAQGCGTFGGSQIVCPFHGWRWNLDGSESLIYGRKGFIPESITSDKVSLSEVRHQIRYGFIWITFDNDAPTLDEFFGTIDKNIAPLSMDKMRVRWWKYTVLDANWKVALEAFMEAYHIMQAHPELAMGVTGEGYNPDSQRYALHGMGHVNGVYKSEEGTPFDSDVMGFGEFFLEQNRVLFEGTDGTNTIRDETIADRVRYQDLPDEAILPTFMQEYSAYAKDAGIPLPPPNPDAAQYAFLFPNMVLLGFFGNLLFYRVRPNGDDPNTCIFEVFAMQIPPAAEPEQAPARPEGPLAFEDWPFILRQDIDNIVRQQAGYRSKAFKEATMSPRMETMIYVMHNEIDRYLAR